MLSERSKYERDEPTFSPALVRRREQLLGSDAARSDEPPLIGPGDVEEPEGDPDIPPMPSGARTLAAARPPRRGRLWAAAAAVVLLAVGGGAWLAADRTTESPAVGEVPYVAAEAGPEKVRPESEGGLEVPNQDIQIYNELSGQPSAAEPEVLLPPPEVPMTPPSVAVDEPPAAAAASDIPVVAAPELEPAVETTIEPSAGSDTAAAEPAETQAAAATGAFRIQLAAVKNADGAKAAWKKLTKTHPEVLGGLELEVVKVDRGGSSLYRIQGGMFPDRAAAEGACARLKQKNQDCLVVAPK